MAAGDLLPTEPTWYAAEVNDYLMAPTKDYPGWPWWVRTLDGFGDEAVEAQDVDRALTDGTTPTRDRKGSNLLVLGLRCATGDPGSAELAWQALGAVWRASSTTVELHLWVPGVQHVKHYGRTRGAKVDRIFMEGGVMEATCSFLCTEPDYEVVL